MPSDVLWNPLESARFPVCATFLGELILRQLDLFHMAITTKGSVTVEPCSKVGSNLDLALAVRLGLVCAKHDRSVDVAPLNFTHLAVMPWPNACEKRQGQERKQLLFAGLYRIGKQFLDRLRCSDHNLVSLPVPTPPPQTRIRCHPAFLHP